jgi:hypothetical protein
MDTPDALERQVHQIHELLVGSHADVTWNDHIPDPDNPEQLRQVDITIRRHGEFTLIECRSSRRQWEPIENPLRAAFDETPVPTVTDVARRLGLKSVTRITKRFLICPPH